MRRAFTLEYWIDEDWYVGRLKEIPGVFSQGESLAELEENIQDAYRLIADSGSVPVHSESGLGHGARGMAEEGASSRSRLILK
jgi:predicted RNase H-like HicB family nuclease